MRPTLAIAMSSMIASTAAAEEANDKVKDDKLPFTIRGRVFVRSEARSIDGAPWDGELRLDSARLAAGYRWKDRLRIKVAVEAAGGVSVRDAYLELHEGPVEVLAGRAKLPISAIEQASAWTLPTIDRGAVAEALEDGLVLTGRRDGVHATWEPAPSIHLSLALTQSIAITGEDPARPLMDGAGLGVTARGEVDIADGVEVGAVISGREVNYVSGVGRYWAAGFDAAVDLEDHGLGLRAWTDVLFGTSHFGVATRGDPVTGFLAAQATAAWRFGGEKRGRRYLEPFLSGGYLDPDLDAARDGVGEGAVGLAGGAWKRWRLQGQVSVTEARSGRPAGLGGPAEDIDDEIAARIQLGAAF